MGCVPRLGRMLLLSESRDQVDRNRREGRERNARDFPIALKSKDGLRENPARCMGDGSRGAIPCIGPCVAIGSGDRTFNWFIISAHCFDLPGDVRSVI